MCSEHLGSGTYLPSSSEAQVVAERNADATHGREDPVASAPEITETRSFDFGHGLDVLSVAEELASEAKYLLNALSTIRAPAANDRFQLELRKIDAQDDQCTKCRLLLRIDPLLWFKYHELNTEQNLVDLYTIASPYTEKVKQERDYFSRIVNENKIVRTPISIPLSDWCREESKGGICELNPNYMIYAGSVEKGSFYPHFLVAARTDATPVITINPVKHCNNEDYVQSCDAWQAVLQTLIHIRDVLKMGGLPLNRIYIHFGKWMQQKFDDPTHRDCHAHINIVLTEESIRKISDTYGEARKKHKSKQLFPALVGSVIPPVSHRVEDAFKLVEYMNNSMTPLLARQNRELFRSISHLKAELETMKQENEQLRQLVFGPVRASEEADGDMPSEDVNDTGVSIGDNILIP